LVFVSAVAGVYTQAVLAATLGLSGASDAFFAAVALTLFTTYVVHTSLLNREVPELASLLDPRQRPTAPFWARTWHLTRLFALISALLGVGLFVGAEWAIKLVAPGLPAQSNELAVASIRIMSLPLAIQLSASGLVAAQHALQGQPLIQSTALLYSAALISALVFLTPLVGPISAALGAGIAFCLMFAVVVIGTLRLARRPVSVYKPQPGPRHATSIPLVTLSSIVLFGHTMVGPLIASTLAEGTVAELSFAYRPVEVLARGLPVVIASTVMPSLAAAYARRDKVQVSALSAEVLRLTLMLVLPAAALLTALREPVVSILYQRAAFSVEAAQVVVPTLAWFAMALPGLSIVVVLTSIFFSSGRERWALALALQILVSYALLGLILGRALGGAGVAFGFCVANVLGALVGVAAAGQRGAGSLVQATWFRWTVLASALALAGGSVGVDLTRAYSSVVQLVAGSLLGGLGPLLALVRVRGTLLRGARDWLGQLVGSAPL
jgi:putative peptidoglycan lipid II flippase